VSPQRGDAQPFALVVRRSGAHARQVRVEAFTPGHSFSPNRRGGTLGGPFATSYRDLGRQIEVQRSPDPGRVAPLSGVDRLGGKGRGRGAGAWDQPGRPDGFIRVTPISGCRYEGLPNFGRGGYGRKFAPLSWRTETGGSVLLGPCGRSWVHGPYCSGKVLERGGVKSRVRLYVPISIWGRCLR
jgi:hypothetical protein